MSRVAVFSVVFVLASVPVPAQVMSEEVQAVRAVWDEATAALIARSWERYSQVWAHDADIQVIHPGQRDWRTGWQQVEARYRAVISGKGSLQAETRRFEVRVAPSKDVAWAAVEAVITVNGISHTSWEVVIFQKQNGRWRMVLGFDAPLGDR